MITLFERYKKYEIGDYIKISSEDIDIDTTGIWKLYGLITDIEEMRTYDITFINDDKTLGKSWIHLGEIERLLTPEEEDEMNLHLQTNKYNL